MLCSVGTAGTGSVLVLWLQPQWVNASRRPWLCWGCMNGFLQWPYRVSFFFPSSEANIQGGSPGSRQPKCFSIPLVGMDISGADLMRFNALTEGRNDKDSSENRLGSFCPPLAVLAVHRMEKKTSRPVTNSSVILWICLSPELFAHFAISPRILNTPASFNLIGLLLK